MRGGHLQLSSQVLVLVLPPAGITPVPAPPTLSVTVLAPFSFAFLSLSSLSFGLYHHGNEG